MRLGFGWEHVRETTGSGGSCAERMLVGKGALGTVLSAGDHWLSGGKGFAGKGHGAPAAAGAGGRGQGALGSSPQFPTLPGEQIASSAQQTASREGEGPGRRLEGFPGRGFGWETSVRALVRGVGREGASPGCYHHTPEWGTRGRRRLPSEPAPVPPSTLPGGTTPWREGGSSGAAAHKQDGVVQGPPGPLGF